MGRTHQLSHRSSVSVSSTSGIPARNTVNSDQWIEMGASIITTDGSETVYVLATNLTSMNFNVFAGDLLGTALLADIAVQQIKDWENWDWKVTDFGNPQGRSKISNPERETEGKFTDIPALVTPWGQKSPQLSAMIRFWI